MQLSRSRLLLVLLFAAAPALLPFGQVARDGRAESNVPPPAPSSTSAASAPEVAVGTATLVGASSASHLGFVGAGSCAASNCHGGDGTQRDPYAASDLSPRLKQLNRAYRVWLQHDPHARAYDVLQSELSQRMIEQLNRRPGQDPLQPAHQEELCLNCHSTKPASGSAASLPQHILADGVSCESCHGPAENWLARHYRPAQWPQDARSRETFGFRNTKDLLARAKLCSECHVGGPGRDVNHDLIAAGHPRLNFEFAAYLANMPAHWDRTGDRLRPEHLVAPGSNRTSFETQAYLLGQFASAEAALEQLADRASHHDAVWPEYSEYDCFACHHDLSSESWRQAGSSSGRPQWGTWYFAIAPQLAASLDLDQAAGFTGRLDDLAGVMNQPVPPRASAARLARDGAAEVARLAELLQHPQPDPTRPAILLESLTAQPLPPSASWDRTAQLYLAAAALHLGHREAQHGLARQPSDRERQYQQLLEQLRSKLAFPSEPAAYGSPKGFDPREIDELVKSLGNLKDP